MERNDRSNQSRKKKRVNSKNNNSPNTKKKLYNNKKYILTEKDKANNEAIKALKLNRPECPMCHEPIIEIASCLSDPKTGMPVHFDCVLKKLNNEEKLLSNQKIVYIGKGTFAVVFFENPHDLRRFKIIKQIEWEKSEDKKEWEKNEKSVEWRDEISSLYSQVH